MDEKERCSNKEQPSFVGRLCLMGDDKSYILQNNTDLYYSKLENALHDIKQGKQSDYLYFAFISLASATLEFSLNYILAVHCFNRFTGTNYRSYLDAYTKIGFKNKLLILPQIISNGEFLLDENSKTIKTLYELISLRNKLLHNNEYAQDINFPKLDSFMSDETLLILTDNPIIEFQFSKNDNIINTIDKEQCIKIGESLIDFKDKVMTPYLSASKIEKSTIINQL